MNQQEKAKQFKTWHQPGNPIILYNIWDAGSAKALAASGAHAVATGSKPLAVSQGYADGEQIPLRRLLETIRQICATVDLPVSVDFEGGYAGDDDEMLGDNIQRLVQSGAIGLNFEDQVVGKEGLYSIERQCQRLKVIRQVSDNEGVPLFVNARTDLFLKEKEVSNHARFLPEAIERGQAYHEAGADGFFVPGLIDPGLIEEVCRSVKLPVNVLKSPTSPSLQVLRECQVGRVSYGPFGYLGAMNQLQETAAELYKV